MIVITGQRAHVQQAFDIQVVQLDKNAEVRHGRNHAGESVSNAILQKFAFEPCIHLTRRIIGTSLGHRALLTQRQHAGHIIGVNHFAPQPFSAGDAAHVGTLTATPNDRPDRTMHQ